MHLKDI